MKKLHLLIISILILSFGLAGNSAHAGFSDVPTSHSNSDAISYVQTQGVVSGYPDGNYYPDRTINRAEFTKIIVGSSFDKADIDDCIGNNTQLGWNYVFFPDVPIDAWFTPYICMAKDEGLIDGYPDGTFKPADNINFAEAAKIIVNASGYEVTSDPVWYKPYADALSEDSAIPTSITSLTKAITRGDMAEIVYRIMAEVYDKDSMEFTNNTLVAPGGVSTTPSTPSTPVTSNYTPTLYVGKTNCSDAGAGSQSQPFCTLQTGLDTVRTGDVLMILDGVYKERVDLPNSGTKSNPIVVTGESENAILDAGCPSFPCPLNNIHGSFYLEEEDVYLLGGFGILNQNYITLDGFTIRNAPSYGLEVMGTRGLTVQNMNIHSAVSSLINIYDSFDLKVLNNKLNNAHLGRIKTDGTTIHITEEEAMSIVNTDGFEIANNHLADGYKEGLVAKVGSKNGSIHHNIAERLCAVGIYIDEASNVDVYENTVSDIGFFKKDGVVKRCDDILSGTVNIEISEGDVESLNGLGYEPGVGISLAVGDLEGLDKGILSNVKVYKNVVKNINVGCLNLWDELRENTLTKTGTLTGVEIYNNVFYNCSRSKGNWGPAVTLDKSSVGTKVYNNIFMLASEAIDDQGSSNPDISNNLFYQTNGTAGTGAIEGDPLFTDPSNGDFSTKAGSPAKSNKIGAEY